MLTLGGVACTSYKLVITTLSRLLSDAERGVSAGGLGLLVKHKRRQKLKLLLDVLRKFRTLVRKM